MKKKILLLVYENECEHTLWIGNKLKDNGHEVNLIICDFYSFYGGQDYVLEKCYENGYEKKSIFNIRDELIEINKSEQDDSINIDWDFLIKFEKKLKVPFIMNSVYTDFAFNNIYNPRDYVFVPRNKDIMVKLIELLCKKIDLFSTYHISNLNFFDQLMLLSPFTWAQPVIPGITLSLIF